jgi:hypothetical protein
MQKKRRAAPNATVRASIAVHFRYLATNREVFTKSVTVTFSASPRNVQGNDGLFTRRRFDTKRGR